MARAALSKRPRLLFHAAGAHPHGMQGRKAMPRIYGQDWTRAVLARQLGDTSQVFGIRLATLADGVERGVRTLEVRAGNGLGFDILVDRCMDIGSLSYRGA